MSDDGRGNVGRRRQRQLKAGDQLARAEFTGRDNAADNAAERAEHAPDTTAEDFALDDTLPEPDGGVAHDPLNLPPIELITALDARANLVRRAAWLGNRVADWIIRERRDTRPAEGALSLDDAKRVRRQRRHRVRRDRRFVRKRRMRAERWCDRARIERKFRQRVCLENVARQLRQHVRHFGRIVVRRQRWTLELPRQRGVGLRCGRRRLRYRWWRLGSRERRAARLDVRLALSLKLRARVAVGRVKDSRRERRPVGVLGRCDARASHASPRQVAVNPVDHEATSAL